jgi:hypothetical protein
MAAEPKKKLPVLLRPRPSAYQIAEACARSAWLSHHYPEENAATKHGSAKDELVSKALAGGPEPALVEIEARAIIVWVRKEFPKDARFYVQHRVTLVDPMTGETITSGTPDLLVTYRTSAGRLRLVVIDWKSIGQLYAGHLAAPDDNLQQLIYMVAAGMELAVDEAQIILVCFDATKLKLIEGEVHDQEAWWPFLERIKAVQPIDMEGPQPKASKGDHCGRCYQKLHCNAYLLPAPAEGIQLPKALAPLIEDTANRELSAESAAAALEWLEGAWDVLERAIKLTKQVESQLATYVQTRGPIVVGDRTWGPIPDNGKRAGASVAELEARGLHDLIKPAKPSVKFDWRKAP